MATAKTKTKIIWRNKELFSYLFKIKTGFMLSARIRRCEISENTSQWTFAGRYLSCILTEELLRSIMEQRRCCHSACKQRPLGTKLGSGYLSSFHLSCTLRIPQILWANKEFIGNLVPWVKDISYRSQCPDRDYMAF